MTQKDPLLGHVSQVQKVGLLSWVAANPEAAEMDYHKDFPGGNPGPLMQAPR